MSFLSSPVSWLMNAAVPERAIVPRFSISSSRFMPMPLSAIGQGARGFDRGQHDPVIRVALGESGLGQRGVAQPVAGVRRVRDQFAQEDFFFAVQRVRDDIQQAADFRLKGTGFGSGFDSHFLLGQKMGGTARDMGPSGDAATRQSSSRGRTALPRAAGPATACGNSQSRVEDCTMRWLNLQQICSEQPIDMVYKPLILRQNRKFRDLFNPGDCPRREQ